MKKSAFVLSIILLMMSLSGCKYLRLLQFKNQFQNVSKNFVFIKTTKNPSIKCLHPVLKPEDVDVLTGGVLPLITQQDTGVEWRYVMEKMNPSPKETTTTLVITLFFDQQDTLTQIFYPTQFSSLIHPDFVQTLLEKMGNGRPDPTSKSLKLSGRLFEDAWIPNKEKIIAHLGSPTLEIASKNTTIMIYTYTLKNAVKDSFKGTSKAVRPYIWVTLDNTTQKAIGLKTTVFGPELSL